jgi:hypothetical protein
MKKVYQTIFEKDHGNCMQAAIASLFDEELTNVPNFIEFPHWFDEMNKFANSKGYNFEEILYNKKWMRLNNPKYNCFGKPDINLSFWYPNMTEYKGVDGFFFARVCSPNLFSWEHPKYHAVIMNKYFDIVHDPNPEYKGILNYPFSDIIEHNGITNVFVLEKVK